MDRLSNRTIFPTTTWPLDPEIGRSKNPPFKFQQNGWRDNLCVSRSRAAPLKGNTHGLLDAPMQIFPMIPQTGSLKHIWNFSYMRLDGRKLSNGVHLRTLNAGCELASSKFLNRGPKDVGSSSGMITIVVMTLFYYRSTERKLLERLSSYPAGRAGWWASQRKRYGASYSNSTTKANASEVKPYAAQLIVAESLLTWLRSDFRIHDLNRTLVGTSWLLIIVTALSDFNPIIGKKYMKTNKKKSTNCGTTAADVLANFSRQTLMRIHWIFRCICNCYDFTTHINSKLLHICNHLAVI